MGPDTQRKLQAIKQKIEEAGRVLGIPEEDNYLASQIVNIAAVERLADGIDKFQAEAERWRAEGEIREKKKFNWKKLLEKTSGYVHGVLKSEE